MTTYYTNKKHLDYEDIHGEHHYLCNLFVRPSSNKMTKYPTKVTCMNCMRSIRFFRNYKKEEHIDSKNQKVMEIKIKTKKEKDDEIKICGKVYSKKRLKRVVARLKA